MEPGATSRLAREGKLKFPLLSDFEPQARVAWLTYGVYREHDGTAERALFLIDGQGIVRWSYVSPVGRESGSRRHFEGA